MMRMVHDELPGTTFFNTGQRGGYDSDGKAVLTLAGLLTRDRSRLGVLGRGALRHRLSGGMQHVTATLTWPVTHAQSISPGSSRGR